MGKIDTVYKRALAIYAEETGSENVPFSKGTASENTAVKWGAYGDYAKHLSDFLDNSQSMYDAMLPESAAQIHAEYEKRVRQLKAEGAMARKWLSINRSSFHEKEYQEMLSALKNAEQAMASNQEIVRRQKDFFSQWETNESFNTYIQTSRWLQKYDSMDAGSIWDAMEGMEDGEEKTWLKENAGNLTGFRRTAKEMAGKAEQEYAAYVSSDAYNYPKAQQLQYYSNMMQGIDGWAGGTQYDPLALRSAEETAARYKNKAGFLRQMAESYEMESLMENIEEEAANAERAYREYIHSEEYAAWQMAAADSIRQRNFQEVMSGGTPGSGRDLMVNKKATELKQKAEYYRSLADQKKDAGILRADMKELAAWSEEDRSMLETFMIERNQENMQLNADRFGFGSAEHNASALIQKYGRKKVLEMAESLARYQNQQNAAGLSQAAGDMAGDSFWGGAGSSALAVAGSVMGAYTSPLGYVMELGQRSGRYSTLDPNNAGMLPNLYSGAVKAEVGGNIEQSAGKPAAVLYTSAMSAAENLARLAITGGYMPGSKGGVSLALAAAGSFGQSVSEYSAQGASPAEALLMGVANGALEVITEKISMDKLLDNLHLTIENPKNFREIVKAALQAGLVEVTEEEASFVGGLLAEAVILRRGNAWAQRYQELRLYGLPEDLAREQATMTIWNQVVETAVQSFLSGGMMSGATNLYGNMRSGEMGSGIRETFQNAGSAIKETFTPKGKKASTGTEAKAAPEVQPADAAKALESAVREALESILPEGRSVDMENLPRVEKDARNAYNQGRIGEQEFRKAMEYVRLRQQERERSAREAAVREADGGPLEMENAPGKDRGREAKAAPEGPERPQEAAENPAGEIKDTGPLELELAQVSAQLEDMATRGQFGPEFYTLSERWSQLQSQINNEQQGGMNDGEAGSTVSDRGQAYASVGAREYAGGNAAGRAADQNPGGEQGRADSSRQALAKALVKQGEVRKVSAQEIGFENGTEKKNLVVIPRNHWDEALSANARTIEQTTRCEVHYIVGRLTVYDGEGKIKGIHGMQKGKDIYIRADHGIYNEVQIGKHESFHAISRENPELVEKIRRRILESFDGEELREIIERYKEKYAGLYSIRSEDEVDQIILEEIFANAYAQIGDLKTVELSYHEDVEAEVERSLCPKGRQEQENGSKKAQGPPEGKYSIDDTSMEIEKDMSIYPYNMQTVIRDYIDAVDESLLQFIEETHEGNSWKGKKYTVGTVSNKMAEDIGRIAGVDIAAGSPVILNTDTVMHIESRHGSNGSHDKTMSDSMDLARINYVIQNYDDAQDAIKLSAGHKNKDRSKAKTVLLSKKINGTYFVVEAVPDTGKAWIITAYMQKKGAPQVPDDNAPGGDVRNEFASAPKNSIAENTGNVNDDNSDIRYSVEEDYAEEIDAWNRSGRPEGAQFILGATGDVMQGLGAIESDIYINGDKVQTILKTHPEMTLAEIKRIPEVLEDPVLILKSRNVRKAGSDDRIVIFNTIKAKDGRPIMCVMDMRPVENGFAITNMQKVSSAYTKDNNPVYFISNSDVLYADKKRTTPLLRSVGFHVPTELQRSGYIGNISYTKRNVNIHGVPFKEIIAEEGQGHYSVEDDTGEAEAPDYGLVTNALIKQFRERYSYGGPQAAEADKAGLARAMDMLDAGADPEDIRQDTGWFQGADRMWRFEIDDSGMRYHRPDTGGVFYLKDVLEHEALFRNYPWLEAVRVRYQGLPKGIGGQYSPRTNTITLSDKMVNAEDGVLLHEIQHAIQHIEDFSPGASVEYWQRQLDSGFDSRTREQKAERKRLWKTYRQIQQENPAFFEKMQDLEKDSPQVPRGAINWDTLEKIEEDPPEWKAFDARRDALEEEYGSLQVFDFMDLHYKLQQIEKAGRDAGDLYYDTAGEIEARDTAQRKNLTQEQRRQKKPFTGSKNTTVFSDGREVSYSRDTSFSDQVDQVLNNTHDKLNHVYMGNTPKQLVKILGLPRIPVLMTSNHVYSMSVSQNQAQTDNRYKTGVNYHDLGSTIKKLPEALNDPAIIIKSSTKENDLRFVVVTALTDRHGRPIMAAFAPAERGNYYDVELDANILLSGYGRKNYTAYVERARNEGRILYVNKKYSQQFKNTPGVQFPNNILNADYSNSLARFQEAVKAKAGGIKEMFSLDDTGEREESQASGNFYSIGDGLEEDHSALGRALREQEQYTAEQKDIQKINRERAEETAKYLQKQQEIQESRPTLAKKNLGDQMVNLFSVSPGQKQNARQIIDRYADRMLQNGELTEEDRKSLFDQLYASGVVVVPADEYYAMGRQAVAGNRIYIDNSLRMELGDDFQMLRRQAFANGIYLTSDRSDPGLDTVNHELAELLPGLFDSEETDMRTILETILDVAADGKDEHLSLADYTARLAGEQRVSEDEILDGIERQMDIALRVFAENAKLEIKLRSAGERKLSNARRKSDIRFAKELYRQRKQREAEKQARREMAQEQRQRRELRELQQKTLKQLKWLRKNRMRAGADLKSAFDEVLSDIDLLAIGEPGPRYKETWDRIAQSYKQARESDPNFLPSAELEKVVSRIDGQKIADLDVAALENLYRAAVGLRTEFYNRNNVINDELHRMFDEVFEDTKKEIQRAPKGTSKKMLNRLMNIEQLTPMNVLQRMVGWNPDSTFYSMARQLEKGERDVRAYTVKANRELEEFLNANQEWVKKADGQGKDPIWYELEVPQLVELKHGDVPVFGPTVKVWMTPAQKVHLYLESKNLSNLAHMAGGRTFVNKERYQKGERQEAFAQGTTIRLAPETVKKLVKDLTQEEMELARVLEHYYNVTAAGEINKISNLLYGYDKAVGHDYAPIISNQNYTHSEIGKFDATAEGVGSMKERIQGSRNPSYNISAFDAFERHVDHTARFVGMAVPTRNWNTLLNWYSGSLSTKELLTQKWGQESLDYITNILNTLQSGVSGDSSGRGFRSEAGLLPDKIMSNYISAVFGFNPSIVLKQLGSIPLASAYLGCQHLPSIQQLKDIDRSLIAKYTQELDWRTMGYSMPETRQLKENPNWSETNKITQFAFGGGAITAMDGWAASTLWPWAENKVRSEHPELAIGNQAQIDAGQSPFYQKVAEEFNDAVSRSQSVSDEIHQGELRKNKNPVVKAFTMFRSDSAQTYNTLRQKMGEAQFYRRQRQELEEQYKQGRIPEENYREKVKTGEAAIRKRQKAVGATVTAMLANAAWAEIINLLMNLWKYKGRAYKDEEGELDFWHMAGEMTKNMLGSMAGVMIGGEELAGLLGVALLGDDLEDIDSLALEQINNILEITATTLSASREFIGDVGDILKNGDLKDLGLFLKRKAPEIAGGIKELSKAAAMYIYGVPAGNVEAYLLGLMKWFLPELEGDYRAAMGEAESLNGLKGENLKWAIEDALARDGISRNPDTAQALLRLHEAGHTGSVPKKAPDFITVNGKKYSLSTYNKQAYETIYAGIIGQSLDNLVACAEFRSASPENQYKMLKYLYDYAADMAETEFAMTTLKEAIEISSMSRNIDGLKAVGLDPVDAIRIKAQQTLFSETYQESWDRAVAYSNWMDAQNWSEEQRNAIEERFPYQKKAMEQMDKYANMGVEKDTAVRVQEALDALTPMEGEKSVTWSQKMRAVADLKLSEEEQLQAMISVTPSNYTSSIKKMRMLPEYNVSSTLWLEVKEATWSFDINGNGSIDQGEMTAVLDAWGGADNNLLLLTGYATPLSNREKAILWQLQNASWKPNRNPYDTKIGKEIYDRLNEGD